MGGATKNRIFGLLTMILATTCGLLASELIIRRSYFTPGDREQGSARLWRNYGNEYLRLASDQGCAFSDSLIPHPVLGFVHTSQGPCRMMGVNNLGIPSKYDLPAERDPNFFSILVLGGSVASQLSTPWRKDEIWLESYLNARFVSPNGKPFRVIGGAVGAWGFPNQVIMTAKYGRFVDAVIAIDGYNEATHAEWTSIDISDINTYLMAAEPMWALETVGITSALSRFRRVVLKLPLLRDSFLAYFAWVRLASEVAKQEGSGKREEILRTMGLPEEWSKQKKLGWNREHYMAYVRELDALAKANGIRYAQFLQPMPLIGKKLTEEETRYKQYVSKQVYETVFERAYQELRQEKRPTVSLTQIFSDIPETVYRDHVHCAYSPDGNSRGYALISEWIGKSLGQLWGLKPRSPQGRLGRPTSTSRT